MRLLIYNQKYILAQSQACWLSHSSTIPPRVPTGQGCPRGYDVEPFYLALTTILGYLNTKMRAVWGQVGSFCSKKDKHSIEHPPNMPQSQEMASDSFEN